MEHRRLDPVLEAGRYLPLSGDVRCRAVVIEATEMRRALLAALPAGETAGLAEGLRLAPVLVALCDMSDGGSGRAAAFLAAAQMALVAEAEGLASLVVPMSLPPGPLAALPLPAEGRLEAILALGMPEPGGGRATMEAPPRGVQAFTAAAPPPRLERSGGEDQQVLASFMEIASATAGADDLDETLLAIARALGRLFPVDGAALGLADEDAVVVREILRRGEAVRREPQRLPADGSHLMGHVIRTGRPLLRNDVPAEVRFTESLPGSGMRSDMVIPLRARGRITGAFSVGCRRRHAFDPGDFEVLNRCADLTAVAVETQRLLLRTKKLAEIDGLTGVANHRHFLGVLDQEVEAARRSGRPLGLLMIDIDDFKRCNDTYGHPAGDEALHHVAQIVARLLRRSDTVARYGGEEFAAILPDSALEGARAAAETIRSEIERTPLALATSAHPLQMRVSIGVASLPADAATAEDLVAAADRGLYQAKHTGKNRICHLPLTAPPDRQAR